MWQYLWDYRGELWERLRRHPWRLAGGLLVVAVVVLVHHVVKNIAFGQSVVWNDVFVEFLITAMFTCAGFVAACVGELGDLLDPTEIDTKNPEKLAREAELVIYVSYLPDFQDWFRPELVKYLINSSPPLQGTTKARRGIRVFVLPQAKWNRMQLHHNRKDTSYKNTLIDIHGKLGVEAYHMTSEKLQELAGAVRCSAQFPLDFCVAYHVADEKHMLRDIMQGTLRAYEVAVPNSRILGEVTGFTVYGPMDTVYTQYDRLAQKMVALMFPDGITANKNFQF